MDDNSVTNDPAVETPVQVSEPAPAPPEPESSQPPDGSKPSDLPPEAPESPINASTPTPVESQNGGVNQSESKPVEPPKESENGASPSPSMQPVSAPAPQTSVASQPQSLAQQDQTGFIRTLLAKANARLGLNRQKKLDNLMQLAQKKHTITNDDVQKLLRVSDATATRYLVKLVQQGRLARAGNPRDAKYQFLR